MKKNFFTSVVDAQIGLSLMYRRVVGSGSKRP